MSPTGKTIAALVAIVVATAGATAWWLGKREQPAPEVPNASPQAEIAEPKTVARPNVVLISLDTLRADHLGCYGYEKPTSPHLDRIAAEGVLFRRAYSQAPWTLMSHMSLLCSRLPSRCGVESLNQVLPAEFPTLTEVFQGQGYETAALVNNGQIKAHWGFDRGFDHWREFAVDAPEGSCESITAAARDWLGNEHQEPFFLWLHYYDTHDPYDPPPDLAAKFGATLTGAQARVLAFAGRRPEYELPASEIAELQASYDGEIARVDRQLKLLWESLPANTLVVVHADHGEAFEEHGWTLHGGTLADEELHVPLIFWHPEMLPQREVAEPVALLDVAPSSLGLCGLAAPGHFEGEDLRPALTGKQNPELPPQIILAENKAMLEGQALRTARLGDWKLIYDFFRGPVALYRHPNEMQNLWQPDVPPAEVLLEAISDWQADEAYWLVHVQGEREYEIEMEVTEGEFVIFVAQDWLPEPWGTEVLELSQQGQKLRWRTYPRGGSRTLLVQTSQPNARLTLSRVQGKVPDVWHAWERVTAELPQSFDPLDRPRSPTLDEGFASSLPGVHVFSHRDPQRVQKATRPGRLSAETIRQLRSLGYLR